MGDINDTRLQKNTNCQPRRNYRSTMVTGCSEYKYLGCYIQQDLKWNTHIGEQMKKCIKRKFLLRTLNKVNVDGKILALYYNSMIISVLTYVISSWYKGCGTEMNREIARVEKQCSRLIKKEYHKLLLHPESIYTTTAISTAKKILTDPLHPLHQKFKYLSHGIRLNVLPCRTQRYQNTYAPSIIKVFNQQC